MHEEKNEYEDLPETLGMTEPSADPHPYVEIAYKRLLENYRSLIRAREIYYPLAYRFTRRLGSGRQGVVFNALRQGARGCVTRHAIKVHDPSIYPNTEKYWTDMGRIASQISTLQRVSSPQLVSRDIYEEVDGIGYTQMEAVEGVDVHDLIQGRYTHLVQARSTDDEWAYFNDVVRNREGVRPGVALYIMRQALRGLEVLHNAGFLHSDIKPANMMVDRLGLVKLIDYGRAVKIDDQSTYLMGTPLYMAPELHRKQRPTVQSDLYSIGLVGLELLRGGPIPEMRDLDEPDMLEYKLNIADRVKELLPESVRKNEVFVDLFRTFLMADPEKRYATATEAESGSDGLIQIHKQLTLAGKDTEYDRELEHYVGKAIGELGQSPGDVEELIG